MPKYLIKRDTVFTHLGKIVKAGEEVDIEWPKAGDGTSAEPQRLSSNLELVTEDDDDKPARGGRQRA